MTTLQERLEQLTHQYRDAQQQLVWFQERIVFLAGQISLLQELLKEEPADDATEAH
jgi:hypothetical protein